MNQRPENLAWEKMEACRPGSADLDFPEMEELAEEMAADSELRRRYERLQQFDSLLGSAFADVPVPAGFEQRLLAKLGCDENRPEAYPSEPVAEHAVSLPQKRSRLPLGIALAVGGVAAAILVACFLMIPGQSDAPPEMVFQWAMQWHDEVFRQSQWNDPVAAPASHPRSSAVLGTVRGWRRVNAAPLDDQAVVYDLTPPGQPRALLFVVRTSVELRRFPTEVFSELPSTGGFVAGIRQTPGLLQVLVVEGDQRRFQRFVRPPRDIAQGESLPAKSA